jgi:hypothetical protein
MIKFGGKSVPTRDTLTFLTILQAACEQFVLDTVNYLCLAASTVYVLSNC